MRRRCNARAYYLRRSKEVPHHTTGVIPDPSNFTGSRDPRPANVSPTRPMLWTDRPGGASNEGVRANLFADLR